MNTQTVSFCEKSISHMVKGHVKQLAAEYHNLMVCADIGAIADSNPQYTAGITRRIEATGKTIEDLTVGELLKLKKQYNAWFNSLSA